MGTLASSSPQERYRYWAFVSYSHKDRTSGEWLHKSIEAYRVARPLQGRTMRLGAIPPRLLPVFRDRDELAAAPDLGERIEAALTDSRYLIVVCSPASAASPWVNKEIVYFKSLGREDRVFSLIVDGEPFASDLPGREAEECFPAALRFQIGADGRLSDTRAEPLAADLREDKDGRQNALLKLIAGMLDVGFDNLRQRHLEARNARLRKIAAASVTLVLVFAALAVYAVMQQRRAEEQQRLAEERSRVALSRQLAAQSGTLLQTSPDLPLLLGLEALFASDTIEARRSLFDAIMVARRPTTSLRSPAEMLMDVMALSPDGKTLVTAGRKGPLVFWDLTQDPPRTHVEPFPAGVNAIAVNRDGTLLAVADAEGTIELRDLKSHQRAAGPVIPKQPSEVTGLAFGPANLLAFAYTSDESSGAAKIHLWDLAKQEAAGSFDTTADGSVSTLAFSPDGRLLASSGVGAETILWDRATGEKVQSDFLKDTGSLAFSPDGQWLASGSWQLTVRKASDFEAVEFPLPDAPAHVSAVRFSPDGKVLVSGSTKGTVIVWDVATRRPLDAPYQLKMGAINDLVLSPDGRTAYAGNAAGQLAIVALDTTPLRRVVPTRAYVGDLRFNAATGELASSDDKGNVNFWNASSGSLLRQMRSSHGSVVVFAISPDGKTIAVGDVKGRVSTWDAGTLRSLSDPAQVKNDRIDRLEFAPDGFSVAVAGIDPEVAIWDAAQGRRSKTLTADKEYARYAVFTQDGSRLITVGDAGDVIQWDWRTGERIGQAMKAPSGADALALSPDGLLAVGGYDDRITLWDPRQGQMVGVPLVAHTNIVRTVTFSADGRFMASGGDDGVAILWDVKSRQPIAHFRHGETVLSGDGSARTPRAVNHVSFSPDGSVLATDGPEDALLLWDVNIASWKEQACHRTNRNLTAEEWRRYIGDLPYRETCPGGRPRSEL